MTDSVEWRAVWEAKSTSDVPDFDLDRGMSARDKDTENLSAQELLAFIQPQDSERLLDAGCGTGVNILRLHSRVRSIVGIDYASGSVERCSKRLQALGVGNVSLLVAGISEVPFARGSFDKVLCLSVLQYIDDDGVRKSLREFARLLSPGGEVILHVKNKSSIYWSTLLLAKRVLALFGAKTDAYNVRPFGWYIRELQDAGFRIADFNSCNAFVLDAMPKPIVSYLQRFELKHHDRWFLRNSFIRSHGADLKIKARIG
ncbi:MAG: class I SAM-dependent methyltransferase [Terracidiphilus sp.]